MQILLLHGFKDAPNGLNIKIWKIVQFGILLVDLGLIYGTYVADGLDVKGWEGGDWGNHGILGALVLIRTSFLIGVGEVGAEYDRAD